MDRSAKAMATGYIGAASHEPWRFAGEGSSAQVAATIRERLGEYLMRLHGAAESMESIAAQVHGPRPRDAGLIPGLADDPTMPNIEGLVRQIGDAVSRLEIAQKSLQSGL